MLKELNQKWKSWHLTRDIKAGRVLRGRQPSSEVNVKAEPKATLTMRVYRAATNTWEDVN